MAVLLLGFLPATATASSASAGGRTGTYGGYYLYVDINANYSNEYCEMVVDQNVVEHGYTDGNGHLYLTHSVFSGTYQVGARCRTTGDFGSRSVTVGEPGTNSSGRGTKGTLGAGIEDFLRSLFTGRLLP